MTEIWDLVDDGGNKIGVSIPREKRSEIREGQHFPCVEVWVKVGDSLLITRRHPDKSEGLKYDVPGGGVLSGESFTEAALRELYEEVGITSDGMSLVYLGGRAFGKAYAVSFLLTLPFLPEIRLQTGEVVDYRLVKISELSSMNDELTEGTRRRFCLYRDQIA